MSSVVDTQNLQLKRIRISRIDPQIDKCEWCKQEKMTGISEIWSIAFPEGRLVRICFDCGDCCAGA